MKIDVAKDTDHIDWFILLAVSGLMLFSIAFVYSASASFAEVKFGASDRMFWNHALRVVIGLGVILFFAKFDYRRFKNMSQGILLAAIGCLLLVFFIGTSAKGASRWIHLGPINFQPSEFAKFALVLHLSSLLAQKQKYIRDFKQGLLPLLLWTGGVCGLIALQPNFSTAFAIALISAALMFVGNVNSRHFAIMGGIGLAGAALFAVSAPYRMRRLMAYFGAAGGTNEATVINYQLNQALIAFGSGGITGVGPGQSQQRNWYLPEAYGDFIFSIVGEEYGYMGVFAVLVCFGIILWRGMLVARRAPDDFGYFLATGITFTLALYAFINAGVNSGILPTTGLPMPFISYGGTSVLFSAAAIGILLNISSKSGVYPRKKLSV
jgi:cell division protein FtsW